MGIEVAIIASAAASASSAWAAQKKMINDSLDGKHEAPRPKVSKCESCGSREFLEHNMVRICSYCRSEA